MPCKCSCTNSRVLYRDSSAKYSNKKGRTDNILSFPHYLVIEYTYSCSCPYAYTYIRVFWEEKCRDGKLVSWKCLAKVLALSLAFARSNSTRYFDKMTKNTWSCDFFFWKKCWGERLTSWKYLAKIFARFR